MLDVHIQKIYMFAGKYIFILIYATSIYYKRSNNIEIVQIAFNKIFLLNVLTCGSMKMFCV